MDWIWLTAAGIFCNVWLYGFYDGITEWKWPVSDFILPNDFDFCDKFRRNQQ
jgi:hypothetical protein